MMDFSHLTPLIPEAPARLLLLGKLEPARLGAAGYEIVEAEGGTRPDTPTPFDTAIWQSDDQGVDAGSANQLLDQLLSDGGRVIVIASQPADAPASSRRQGALPSRHEPRLREVVRRLSEAGFAIRKDQDVTAPGGSWKLLVARRDPFRLRSYVRGDEEAILRLFRASFHVDRSLDHWRWKYRDNPWGEPMISVAEHSSGESAGDSAGELTAHYGGYPIPVWYDRRTFLTLQIGDTMTDPAARDTGRGKAGLLARTVRHFFSAHRDGSFGFFYGFNTGPIQRFCRWFIGGSQDRPVRYLARELEPAPEWRSGGYRIERVDAVGPAWDRLFRRAAPRYRFLVRRDAEYLNWRYLKRPDASYVILAARRFGRLVGWCVFLRREDSLRWGDAFFHPRHLLAAEPILAAALTQPEFSGTRLIDAWFSGGPPGWDDQLERLGFTARPEPQGLGMIALADAEPEAFDRLGEMYTAMGDGDLF